MKIVENLIEFLCQRESVSCGGLAFVIFTKRISTRRGHGCNAGGQT
jgi:hypothetical protein